MHTNTSLDIARALTPGDSWWDRPKRRSIIRLAATGIMRLGQMLFGR